MKRNRAIILVLVLAVSAASAQQTARYSNYLFNPLALNPAAAGSYDYINVMGIYRNQWAGLEGAPKTAVLSVDGSVKDKSLGLGLQFISENIGALRQRGLVPTAAYRLRIGDESWLSGGFSLGIFNNRLMGSELIFKDPTDVAIPTTNEGVTYVDVNTGAYLQTGKTTLGLSAVNLLKPSLRYADGRRGDVTQVSRQFNLYGAYLFQVSEKFRVQPSVLLKTTEQLKTFQADFAAMAFYKNLIGVGLSFRNKESVNFILDYWITEDFRLGYAFDVTTSKLTNYESGTHEIMLAYKLVTGKHIMQNPRNYYNN